MRKQLLITGMMLFMIAGSGLRLSACTNFLFTKGATVDGSVMITYSADSHTLYGELYYKPAKDYSAGMMLDVYEWDTGKRLGKIQQVRRTYSVVGNMNEYQVALGETTYGGREELQHQAGAIIDYGSMMYLAMQRAKTAREALQVMTDLVEKYGYYSEGESISVSDKNEAWIFEIISKGEKEKGAVWVARRIPDGYICAHANQARITQFPLNDPENCIYSKDVITFARANGWFDGKDEEFSFSDTYAPVTFSGARACEGRVWAMFNRVNNSMGQYEAYAMGNVTKGKWGYAINRMPLWIKPDKKVSVHDVMELMRDHFEGTKMDMNNTFSAGPFNCPYLWRPMYWTTDSVNYFVNERAVSTQQTGFVFVAQSRSWLPDPIGGIFWFGVDDTFTTVFSPMYCGILKVPHSYAEGNGSMVEYSPTSAFWTFNWVANWAYTRYNSMIVDIQKVQRELELGFIDQTAKIDQKAAAMYKTNPAGARAFLTNYSVKTGDGTVTRWKQLGEYLLVKYIDGNIKKEKDGKFQTNGTGQGVMPNQPGYPKWWLNEIVREHGDVVKEIKVK